MPQRGQHPTELVRPIAHRMRTKRTQASGRVPPHDLPRRAQDVEHRAGHEGQAVEAQGLVDLGQAGARGDAAFVEEGDGAGGAAA